MKQFSMILAAYLLCASLTFGHQGARFTREGRTFAETEASMAAIFWPIYWPFRLSWDGFSPVPAKARPCPAP